MISTIVNRCKQIFSASKSTSSNNRQKSKKQKSEEIDEPSPNEICNDRYMFIKRGTHIGNLITFRSKAKLDQKIYPEKKEIQEAKPEPPPEITPETSPKTLHWTVIKVKIEIITGEHYKQIIEKYNETKPSNWPPLERLDRAEGGFQLEIPEKRGIKCRNANDKIKQLRWKNKALVQHNNYITFNEGELEILFNAMLDVLGKDVYVE
uniref:Uncharacterized protein n=1 Tax=viral metagenome TaxID=1070528 RepID=A0A6C0KK28_9ZZZZ